jgi:hypothetical protein
MSPSSTPTQSLSGVPGTPSMGGPSLPPGVDPSGPLASGSPSVSAGPVGCTSVTPSRVERVTSQPARTTEVVSVVSDGRGVTPGTREQTEFLAPTLTGSDGAQIADEAAVKKVVALVSATGRRRVLVTRPAAPDANVNPDKPPFNAQGTYILFNASAPIQATVIGQCNGLDQRLTFTAESDPTSGQVNCAVEPAKTSSIAHLVYANNCS